MGYRSTRHCKCWLRGLGGWRLLEEAKVVAFNEAGKHRVLEAVDPDQTAEDRMVAIQRDYDLLSTEAWCEKYHVPTSFAEG